MIKRILIVAATETEADALKRIARLKTSRDGFCLGEAEISLLITGVGTIATAWSMSKWLSSNAGADLVLNIGIAGSFREDISIGEVVVPVSDCFADAGIESGSKFLTLAEAGLTDPDTFPFNAGRLRVKNRYVDRITEILRPVNAVTVNTATGSASTAEKLTLKFEPDIETMEGAAFFYICSRENLPFLALRSISNMIEPGNRKQWKIPLAVNTLSEKLEEILLIIN